MLPATVLLGSTAHDPDGSCTGRVVAVFESYQAALKFGTWDQEYVPPGGRWKSQRFVLLYTTLGALLLGASDLRYGSGLVPLRDMVVMDPALVRQDEPWDPKGRLAVRPEVAADRARVSGKKRRSAILRRRPVLGVGA